MEWSEPWQFPDVSYRSSASFATVASMSPLQRLATLERTLPFGS